MFTRLQKRATALKADESGNMLVIAAISLTAFLGVVALSFDIGRVTITHSEMQSFADSVALAAAGELDGRDDAITRATNAAQIIADTQIFGNANNDLAGAADYTLTFLSALPADDLDAPNAITTDPRNAVYVRVQTVDVTVSLTFGAAFAALSGNQEMENDVAAEAIAGYTQYACDVTPLMFCMPDPNWTAEANVGQMIQLRDGGQGAAWGPGNFGFLDPGVIPEDSLVGGPCAGVDGQIIRCLFGAEGPVGQCYRLRGVDTYPGQSVGVNDVAFNTRFDMFQGALKNERNNLIYAPAPNVIKGLVPGGGGSGNGSQCLGNNVAVSPDTRPIPRDDCFGAGTCGGRFGDGDWSVGRAEYVQFNYGGLDPHPSAVTRWDYYKAEVAAAGGASGSTNILTGRSETGRPSCSNQQSGDVRRRIVVAAAIDCTTYPISGSERGVPVEEFVEVFLTEPVSNDGGSPAKLEIHVEVVGSAGGDGAGTSNLDGIFRDVVQLYR